MSLMKRLLILNLFAASVLLQACNKSSSDAAALQDTEALAAPGSYDNVIYVDNIKRTYHLHIPPSFDSSSTSKLLLHLHGTFGDDQDAREKSGFDQISDQEGFIVVYPNSTISGHWNDGRDPIASNADDIGYIKALIYKLSGELNIGARQVYMSGMSNGAIFAHRFACEAPELISAIAAVAGTMAIDVYTQCNPSQPVSALMFHGEDDPYVLWEGGVVPVIGGTVISVIETLNYWSSYNNCSVLPDISFEPDIDPFDGTLVKRIAYAACNNQTSVVLYDITGGGHTWPGSPGTLLLNTGVTSFDINASSIIWDFFQATPVNK